MPGTAGTSGIPGKDGAPGASGPVGATGLPGPKGEAGVTITFHQDTLCVKVYAVHENIEQSSLQCV